MLEESHRARIKESLEVIADSVARGLAERQRTIGFHASAASADMLELYLHRMGLIDPGAVLKHEWFTSMRRAEEHLPPTFEGKAELVPLLIRIESRRSLLCYATPRAEEVVEEVLLAFHELRKVLRRLGLDGV
jgi:hypothetical protein